MTSFDSLSPEEFAALAYIVGITLAIDNDVSENAVIGSFFSLISSVIITFAAQQQRINNINDNNNSNDNNSDNSSIKDLEERIKKLEEKLK